jgi:hypothetical protein
MALQSINNIITRILSPDLLMVVNYSCYSTRDCTKPIGRRMARESRGEWGRRGASSEKEKEEVRDR